MLKQGATTLCWPNLVERGVLSGGNWDSQFPISHAADPIVQKASRSADLELSSTQFSLTIDKSRPVGVVGILNHNINTTGQWRVRLYFDDAQTSLAWDSGWKDVWPAVYSTQELEWEYDNFWLGTFDDDDVDRFTSLATEFIPQGSQVVRSVKVEIDDQNNPHGFIKIGRVFIADVWQPKRSAQYGIEYGHNIGTTFETADNRSMTEYADPKTPKRTVSFNLAVLDEEEGFRRTLAMQRDQGIHREILYTENPIPTVEGFQKTFLGRFDNVSPLTHPSYRRFSTSINLIEIL